MTVDVDIDEAFGFLHDLSDMDMNGWREAFTPNNMLLVQRLWIDLWGEKHIPTIGEFSQFIEVLRDLMHREAYWSRAMGLALLEAEKLMGLGQKDKAISILDDFLSSCSAPSFKEIAQTQKENYLMHSSTDS